MQTAREGGLWADWDGRDKTRRWDCFFSIHAAGAIVYLTSNGAVPGSHLSRRNWLPLIAPLRNFDPANGVGLISRPVHQGCDVVVGIANRRSTGPFEQPIICAQIGKPEHIELVLFAHELHLRIAHGESARAGYGGKTAMDSKRPLGVRGQLLFRPIRNSSSSSMAS
jgi:hypothetical protein